MNEIYLNSAFTSNSIEEIKLLSLYYDKIFVPNDAVYSLGWNSGEDKPFPKRHSFLPENFYSEYDLLIKENIIRVIDEEESKTNEFAEEISSTLNSNRDLFFLKEKNGNIVLADEVQNILLAIIPIDERSKPISPDFIWWYYAKKLQRSIVQLMEGQTCFTSSQKISELIRIFIENNREGILRDEKFSALYRSINFPLQAMSLTLPNPKCLPFDDILFLKNKLRDELDAFQYEMFLIQRELFKESNNYSQSEIENLFYGRVEKPLKDLKDKSQGLNNRSLRRFVQSLQNPLAYAPLIGTFVASAPLNLMAALSLGLISIDTALQHIHERKEIERNGLSFLLKISQNI